jgi:glycosyltransferase involved in cell wall biosynthesis
MKYSFLIPVYNRAASLRKTLNSFVEHYSMRTDYEVILIESYYNDESIEEIIREYNDIDIKHKINGDDTYSCCVCYNDAGQIASGDYFIITNPDGPHTVDVLKGFDKEFEKQDCYVICACENVDSDGNHLMWYQHSQHNNRMLHFCSCISRKNWLKLNGFCEAYANGCAFEDDDWLKRVKTLDIPIVVRDDLIIQHIEHERGYLNSESINRNRNLYNFIWDEHRRI